MKRFFTVLCALFLVLGASAQKKEIVAYFSASGTTQGVAEQLAQVAKAELYVITPAQPYTTHDLNYRVQDSRVMKEHADASLRPVLSEQKDLSSYDVVYLGFPIWWGTAPNIVKTFIEQANLNGKTVVTFVTSGGSPVDGAVEKLKAEYPSVQWTEGYRLNNASAEDLQKVVR